MEITILDSKAALGRAAAEKGAGHISRAIGRRGSATIILATGASQFEMLGELVRSGLDWSAVTVFHLDEYLGIPESHPASFRKYLRERFVNLVSPAAFYPIHGEANPEEECARLGRMIEKHQVDVAFVGIGENGHLAFNDPPADFGTEDPYIVVELDEACRRQQIGEGWFPSLESVPSRAISMSVRQIMKSETIICSVPDARKAIAVKNTLEEIVSPLVPASILTTHADACLFLDKESASLLKGTAT
ncbi:MAG: glucosamine-6-phosphate deaminase [Bacteroidales bacterium]|nr:glucosamine-6-phosphate deaminase [Bacteroidales bacterium]